MIKTLRITGILAALTAVGFIVFLAIYGFKGNKEIEKKLSMPRVFEQFKKSSTADAKTSDEDKKPPLVKQAELFALKIDPPPPPPPPKPKEPPKPEKPVQTAKKPSTPLPPTPKGQIIGKFDLVGVCKYEDEPEKSMVLVRLIAKKENKWFRLGDMIDHQKIHEIKDDSIVLYKGDKFSEEKQIQQPKSSIRSLLKSDTSAIDTATTTSASGMFEDDKESFPQPKTPVSPEIRRPSATQTPRSLPPRRSINRRPTPPTRTITNRVPPIPLEKPTPEEQKKKIDNNISGIQELMNRKTDDRLTPEQIAEERKALAELLKVLNEEKQQIDQEPQETNKK